MTKNWQPICVPAYNSEVPSATTQCTNRREMSGLAKTSPKSVPKAYQTSLFGLGAFPAKIAASELEGIVKGYEGNEAACFLSLLDSCRNGATIDPDGLSLRMLKDCSRLIADGTLAKCYLSWPHSGTVLNMCFSTRRTTACPKAVSVCLGIADLSRCAEQRENFLSNETKNAGNTKNCISEAFCKVWRKISR